MLKPHPKNKVLKSHYLIRHLIFSATSFLKILKKYYGVYGFLVLVLVGLSCLAQYIAYNDKFLIFSILLPLVISVFSTCIVGVFSLFVLPYLVQKEWDLMYRKEFPKTWNSFYKEFSTWFREMTKVLIVSYLWAFLLIVPGVIRFLKCAFVSYITLFSFENSHPRKTSYRYTQNKLKYIGLLFFTFIGGTILINVSLPHFWSLNALMVFKYTLESMWGLGFSTYMSIVFYSMYLEEVAQNLVSEIPPQELTL